MNMSKNTIIISVISIIAIFVFLGLVYTLTNKPTPSSYPQVNVIQSNDHVKWSPAKKQILVEYSDLQCPACKAFHQIIKQQIENDKSITGKITFVYRHFPLPIHQYSQYASYAAEAASKQGKFFEFSDILFDTQESWAGLKDANAVKDYFVSVAKTLKLNTDQFKKDMNSDTIKQAVQNDMASGAAANVDATPTFFLNGSKLDNIRSFDDFKKLLQAVN